MSRALVGVWLSLAVRSTVGVATTLPMAPMLPMKPALRMQPALLMKPAVTRSSMWKVWPARAAQAADWPRLAGAWRSLRLDPALREAYGDPAGRGLSHLVSHIGGAGERMAV